MVNKRTGKLMGCHASEGSADRQLRALYAAEGKGKALSHKELADAVSNSVETHDAASVLAGLAAYERLEDEAYLPLPEESEETEAAGLLDRVVDALRDFAGMTSGGHVKAVYKREGGMEFPPRDYAFVPDPAAPSTWKLRLTESPGKVTIAQLARAAAAFSAGGFRGNRVQLPATVIAAVKRRIRAEYRKLGVADNAIPASVKESGRFTLWKQANGEYRWFAVYSNNFRDDDYPPEIISKESHEIFVKMVDEGIVDYPELWHWHIPGTRWGKADWLDFADGFALASGTVDPGHEKEAEALAEMDEIGVSHGMPGKYLMYDENDPSVIVMHATHEISPLPMEAAANKLTGFTVFSEDEMALTADKRNHLLALGIGEDKIAQLESGLSKAAVDATEAGIESKEANPAPADDQVKDGETGVVEIAATIEVSDAADSEGGEAPAPQYVTVEQLAGVMAELVSVMESQATKSREAIEGLTKQVGDLTASKQVEAPVDEAKKEMTPSLSLSSLLGQAGFFGGTQQSVDGRGALAKSKPAEAKPQAAVTGLKFIDNLIAGAPAVESAE